MSRQAICIGINAYPDPRNRLGGCVHDANKWKSYFDRQGFATTLITDEDATYDTIISRLRGMVNAAQPGDVLAFQFAGHGVQIPEQPGGDEADGKDEGLVPVDHSRVGFIVDDDIADAISGLQSGVNLTFFNDCCHSGSNTRGFIRRGAGKARFMVADQTSLEAHHRRQRVSRTRAFNQVDEMDEVLFSACLPREVALEHGGQGDFTRAAMEVLDQNPLSNLTHDSFHNQVLQRIGNEQQPGLYCSRGNRHESLLGARVAPTNPAPGGTHSGGGSHGGATEGTSQEFSELMSEMTSLLDRMRNLAR